MQIRLPEKVQHIISQLETAGFEAYAVGGCIRDSLLGRTPDDWDVTTSAKPYQVKELFGRTIDTGIQHGTVTVMVGREGFEVTTYRIDGVYEDSRHPKDVVFTGDLTEDLRRRDLTINAMAYNERGGLVDVFGGKEDLDRGIIRCVGDAGERFGEDALRMLRAVRFSAQLGFSIAEDTKAAIVKLAPDLAKVSAERIQAELVKLLVSDHPDHMREAYRLGITKIVLPELDDAFGTPQHNPHHIYDVGEHLMHCLLHVRPEKSLRLSALLHDIGKPATRTTDEEGTDHFYGHVELGEEMAVQILKRLKFDNDTIARVGRYIRFHDREIEPDARAVRRAMNKIGEGAFLQVLELKRADALAQSSYHREMKLAHLDRVEGLYAQILEQQQCISLKTLAVTGHDLIALGVPRGKEIGVLLNRLLEEVLEHPEQNTRERLLDSAAKMLV